MKVVVCTPWIEVGCPWRARSRDFTLDFWTSLDVQVVYGHSTAFPLNRAQARNNAAAGVVADVLFFADADMWVPESQFHEAVARAADTGRMTLAYIDHMRLNKWSTVRVLDGNNVLQGQTVKGCSSGAFAITRELWDEVGGNDERYTGWGYEDRSFQFACDTVAGPGERVAGTSYHLWHPRGLDQSRTTEERKRGMKLAQRYKRSAGVTKRAGILAATKDAALDREAMLSLLSEQGGPLARTVTAP